MLELFTGDFLENMAEGKFESDLQWIEAQMELKRSASLVQMALGFYCGFEYGFDMADKLHKMQPKR